MLSVETVFMNGVKNHMTSIFLATILNTEAKLNFPTHSHLSVEINDRERHSKLLEILTSYQEFVWKSQIETSTCHAILPPNA